MSSQHDGRRPSCAVLFTFLYRYSSLLVGSSPLYIYMLPFMP
jgi:hypothetical protein